MKLRLPALTLALLLIPTNAQGDIVYSIDFDTQRDGVQSSISARVSDMIAATVVLELTGNTSLANYSLTLQYDSSELMYLSAGSSESPPGGLNSFLPLDGSTAGRITAIEAGTFLTGPLAPASFEIATLSFRVIALDADLSDFDLRLVEEPPFDGTFNNAGDQLVPIFHGGRVTPAAVPEPTPLNLILLGLFVFYGVRQRR